MKGNEMSRIACFHKIALGVGLAFVKMLVFGQQVHLNPGLTSGKP
jgi:hypothetical protein